MLPNVCENRIEMDENEGQEKGNALMSEPELRMPKTICGLLECKECSKVCYSLAEQSDCQASEMKHHVWMVHAMSRLMTI